MTGPADDETMPKPEDEREGPPKTKPVTHGDVEMPEGAPSTFPEPTKPETKVGEEPPKADDKVVVGDTPKEQETTPLPPCPDSQHRNAAGDCVPDATEQEEPCEDGYHRDAEGNCVPDEPLDERVKRIKAETRASMALGETAKLREDMGKLETVWVSKYSGLDRQLRKSEAYNRQQDKILKQQRDTIRKEQLRCEDLRVEIRDIKNQFADATTNTNKYARLIEDLKIENAGLNKKYHGALEKNLELSKKLTSANEEYLDLAKLKEDLENKLGKARINAKKTLKLRV